MNLKGKLDEWGLSINGEDVNSVRNQIYALIYDKAVSLTYVELSKKPNSDLNIPLIQDFSFRHYIQIQCLRLRKITDSRPDVYSLKRIVDDMRKHRFVLTRENILNHNGVALNLNDAVVKEKEWLKDRELGVPFSRSYTDSLGYKKRVHEQLDKVCGNQLMDQMKLEIFTELDDKLAGVVEISNFVNKLVAHSATPESRKKVSHNDLVVSIVKIDKAMEDITGVYAFLLLFVCGSSTSLVPVGWEQDMGELFKGELRSVSKVWDDFDETTKKWLNWGYSLLS